MLTLTHVCRGDAEDAAMGYEAMQTLTEQGFHPGAAFGAMLAMPDKLEPADTRAGHAWIVDLDLTHATSTDSHTGLMGPETMSFAMWAQLTIGDRDEGETYQVKRWRTVWVTPDRKAVLSEGRIVFDADKVNRYAPAWEVPGQRGAQVQYYNDETGEWEAL